MNTVYFSICLCPLWFLSSEFYSFWSIFRSLTHFEFIFVYGVRKSSNFVVLHIAILFSQHHLLKDLPWWLKTVKHLPTMQESRCNPWVRKISWRSKWQPTPVFLPGKSRGREEAIFFSPLYILAFFAKDKVPIGLWVYLWAFYLGPLVHSSFWFLSVFANMLS